MMTTSTMTRSRRLLLAAAAALLVVAAAASDAAFAGRNARGRTAPVRPVPSPIRYTTWRDGLPEGTFVARSDEEWRAIWIRFGRRGAEAPAFDFSRRMIAGVATSLSDSCVGLRIAGARLTREDAEIAWQTTLPARRDVMCLTAVFHDARFAAVPRRDGDVTFRRLRTARVPSRR